MRFTNGRTIGLLALALFLGGLSLGCDKDSKWYGTYKNPKDNSTLVLQAEHKGTLDAMGTKGDVTWEINGDDKITVHIPIPIEMFRNSDGSLRDPEGTVWKKA
jgi:hypothetical protein